ncbi:hypothetical protein U3516DRAFT_157089 [Neocallimastix sp. 'constans']
MKNVVILCLHQLFILIFNIILCLHNKTNLIYVKKIIIIIKLFYNINLNIHISIIHLNH